MYLKLVCIYVKLLGRVQAIATPRVPAATKRLNMGVLCAKCLGTAPNSQAQRPNSSAFAGSLNSVAEVRHSHQVSRLVLKICNVTI